MSTFAEKARFTAQFLHSQHPTGTSRKIAKIVNTPNQWVLRLWQRDGLKQRGYAGVCVWYRICIQLLRSWFWCIHVGVSQHSRSSAAYDEDSQSYSQTDSDTQDDDLHEAPPPEFDDSPQKP